VVVVDVELVLALVLVTSCGVLEAEDKRCGIPKDPVEVCNLNGSSATAMHSVSDIQCGQLTHLVLFLAFRMGRPCHPASTLTTIPRVHCSETRMSFRSFLLLLDCSLTLPIPVNPSAQTASSSSLTCQPPRVHSGQKSRETCIRRVNITGMSSYGV
jgi:hypothetical protein